MAAQNEQPAERMNGSVPPKNAGTRPQSDPALELEDEVWAALEKSKLLHRLLRDIVNSPNTPKLLDAWLANRHGVSNKEADARIAIANVQAKAALRANVFFVIALLACLFFLGFVIYLLKADRETLLPVLSAAIALIAGTGGGYVFGRNAVTGQ